MSNSVMVKEQEAVFAVNGEEVKLSPNTVKNYLTRGNGNVSDQEVVMFINLCKYQKLNPFLNEAYLVKFGDKPAQNIVSKEAYMKRAESHPNYAGFEAGIIVERGEELIDLEGAVKLSKDKLVGGWAKIFRTDREKPISVRISLSEFNKGQATWNQMPLNMIRKSAIVNAQREAFPETLGAMYMEEDIQEVQPSIDRAVQQEIRQKANKKTISIVPEKIIDVAAVEVEVVKESEVPEEVMAGQTAFTGPGFQI